MMRKSFRFFSYSKPEIDAKISALKGTFSARTPKELKTIFGISFADTKTTKDLDLGESSLDRLPTETSEFIINALYRYNSTFLMRNSLTRDFDGFEGNEASMSSLIEFFIRTLIFSVYEEGVSASFNDPIICENGSRKGCHDLVVYKGEFPQIVFKFARVNERIRGTPLEQAFCNNIFEIYSTYWRFPVWPMFGCVTDLNSWIFLKYDGKEVFRSNKVFKLALHNTAILSLTNKILNIIDSKTK